ncbi:MAG: class I SAM-dependent methyltransferase [Azospirillaceae bacterium]|nr:class I SAM-dependent methyltransferase [Azospirillaceae bacterium]
MTTNPTSPEERTREPQYQRHLVLRDQIGLARFGVMINEAWHQDPRRVLFVLARHKFVARMLAGKANVLEIGCADAFGTRLVQQEVGAVTAVDFDPVFIADAEARADAHWPLTLRVHDLLQGPVPGTFDAAYALDVLEHINPADEDKFLTHAIAALSQQGVLILGMPSLESQAYASPQSREGHVNCKSGPQFRALMQRHFHNVFLFSMNDEVVHTGFQAMAHYLIAVCCGKRNA